MTTIKLNNGVEMPRIGYGVYQVNPRGMQTLRGRCAERKLPHD